MYKRQLNYIVENDMINKDKYSAVNVKIKEKSKIFWNSAWLICYFLNKNIMNYI